MIVLSEGDCGVGEAMLKPRQICSLEKLIDKTKDSIFIVEGKRDKEVLSRLGIRHIFSISGKSLESVAESVAEGIEVKVEKEKGKSIVILTDFDREGKRKAEWLERLIRPSGALIEREARRFFKKSLKVTKIEELKGAVKLLNSTNYGKELNRRMFSSRSKGRSRKGRQRTKPKKSRQQLFAMFALM